MSGTPVQNPLSDLMNKEYRYLTRISQIIKPPVKQYLGKREKIKKHAIHFNGLYLTVVSIVYSHIYTRVIDYEIHKWLSIFFHWGVIDAHNGNLCLNY